MSPVSTSGDAPDRWGAGAAAAPALVVVAAAPAPGRGAGRPPGRRGGWDRRPARPRDDDRHRLGRRGDRDAALRRRAAGRPVRPDRGPPRPAAGAIWAAGGLAGLGAGAVAGARLPGRAGPRRLPVVRLEPDAALLVALVHGALRGVLRRRRDPAAEPQAGP